MLYGISGASGVGKTTVGNLVSESLDIPFLRSSITKDALAAGFNPVSNLSLSDRIDLQEKLLEAHTTMILGLSGHVILDRTPIDMIGYLMGEIYMASPEVLSSKDLDRAYEIAMKCMWTAKRNYDFIFHLAPLGSYEEADTRPVSNRAYQKHVDLILRGALSEMSGQVNHAFLNVSDLAERQEFIEETIANRLDVTERMRKSTPNIH